jgi:hypothetical protein
VNVALDLDPVVEPPALVPSVYGPELPAQRAKDIPGLVSLPVTRLFPDIPRAAYRGDGDVGAIRAFAERSLAGIDLSMIQPGHSVNVVCSEHGFGMDGGLPYAEMPTTTSTPWGGGSRPTSFARTARC